MWLNMDSHLTLNYNYYTNSYKFAVLLTAWSYTHSACIAHKQNLRFACMLYK